MKHHHLPPERDFVLSNAQLIRALASAPSHRCGKCDSKMFVRSESGLCPRCYDSQRAEHAVAELASREQ